jgi:hypothetical protein
MLLLFQLFPLRSVSYMGIFRSNSTDWNYEFDLRLSEPCNVVEAKLF